MNWRARCLQLVALALLASFTASILSSIAMLRFLSLGAAISFISWSIGLFIYHRFGPGKYNLEELRELVLEGKYDDSEAQEVDPEGDLFCPCCQSVYNVRFGVCPTCATRQTRKT